MSGDSLFASVSALVRGNGPDLSTSVYNSVTFPPTEFAATGDIAISTAQTKFGGGSIKFGSSNGSFFSLGQNILFRRQSPMTVEMWVYITARPASAKGILVSAGSGGGVNNFLSTNGTAWHVYTTSTGVGFNIMTAWSVSPTCEVPVPLNTWTHVAFTHNPSLLGFVDGVLTTTVAVGAYNAYNPGTLPTLKIGTVHGTASGTTYLAEGYIEDFRFTLNAARYTADFSVPTAPLIPGLYSVGGTTQLASIGPVSRIVRAYRRDTGAFVGEATSDSITGAFEIGVSTLDELSLLALDDSAGTVENDLVLRAVPS